jgi:hypothetical protein
MKNIALLSSICIYCLLSCQSQEKEEKVQKNSTVALPTVRDSLTSNLQKYYPSFVLKIDTLTDADIQRYIRKIQTDTTICNDFIGLKSFLGEIKNAKCIIKKYGSSKVLFLQTGNLKLWICNLPKEIESVKDSVIITGKVYDSGGDDKTIGFPTVLTNLLIK